MNYEHILYCITNEIFPQYPHEWGWYWADVIRRHAEESGQQVNITEMYWQIDFTHEQHLGSLRHPEMYDYFEGSQNSARNGQENWENMQYAYNQLASHPRPINSVKIYGSDAGISWTSGEPSAVDRFWRNMIGGCASSRFHRPPHGIGLSDASIASIRSMRMFLEEFNIMRAQPDSEYSLLSNRDTNEAYLTAIANEQYAVYFPAGGGVSVKVPDGQYTVEWLLIDDSRWTTSEQIEANGEIPLTVPTEVKYLALITRTE
jgi:hypothetical protein